MIISLDLYVVVQPGIWFTFSFIFSSTIAQDISAMTNQLVFVFSYFEEKAMTSNRIHKSTSLLYKTILLMYTIDQ